MPILSLLLAANSQVIGDLSWWSLLSPIALPIVHSLANSVLHVATNSPEVDKNTLLMSGATEIRHLFPMDQRDAVIDGCLQGLKVVFAMSIAAAGMATCIGLETRWKRLKQERKPVVESLKGC